MPILQINFKLNVPTAEYQNICRSLAQRAQTSLACNERCG